MLTMFKSPPTSRSFWFYNISAWLVLATINLVNRNLQNAESLEQGIHTAIGIVLICTLVSIVLREACHQLNLQTKNFKGVWTYLLLLSIIFGLICAVLNIVWAASYYVVMGYSSRWVIFWLSIQNNWMLMSILMFLWGFVYLAAFRFQKLLQMEQELGKLKDSQLNTLMGQLNPHFLFNGLNNIRSLILEDVDKARDMLTNLADILRYSLLSHKHSVRTLAEELAIVELYIELAKIQYEERLVFQSQVDESLLEQKIPTLLIQLMVENAVRHGIDSSKAGGILNLCVKKSNSNMEIIVTNPGSLEKDSRNKLPSQSNKTGIGIENIRSRLSLMYENRASFNIAEEGELVIATCTLPLD